MADLQNQIRQSQTKVVEWIGEYHRINGEIVEQQFNTKLQSLLASIAEADYKKLKDSQGLWSDTVTLKFIDEIGDKLRVAAEEKERSSQHTKPEKTESNLNQSPSKSKDNKK